MPFVFGYGSLVNRLSRGPYLREWNTRFNARFRREWNTWCLSGSIKYTALGLEPSQSVHKTNGVVFEVTPDRYTQLLQREVGYYIYSATAAEFEDIADITEPISVFITSNPQRPTDEYPINSLYRRVCVDGFRALGPGALEEFLAGASLQTTGDKVA